MTWHHLLYPLSITDVLRTIIPFWIWTACSTLQFLSTLPLASILDGIQHLKLTKDEEEDITISTIKKSDLLEECAWSLFGRLLAERHQNLRALKSTLWLAWKMGSDLRIVEVGQNILQFKFTSMCQMEWVERNGPWNFDNNLLLLTRWRKWLSMATISFTHSPFWVQVWAFPLIACQRKWEENWAAS